MYRNARTLMVPILLGALFLPAPGLAAAAKPAPSPTGAARAVVAPFPYREAGLDERQAAAHLLDRLAFGGRPGEVDRVVATGLERWFETQLAGKLAEPRLSQALATLDALGLSAEELADTFLDRGLLLVVMREAGAVPRDVDFESASPREQIELRRRAEEWMRQQGYRSERELLGQLMAQKLLRAVYAENQLAEVLTDFWFNHFNVSITDNQARTSVLAYERDAIRPRILGRFRDLLEATAKHPAMLTYLDNYQSIANEGQRTTFDPERFGRPDRMGVGGPGGGTPGGFAGRGRLGAGAPAGGMRPEGGAPGAPGGGRPGSGLPNRPQGLNENYARELLELHTLGVDGGYGQADVIEVARAFTGWTIVPPKAIARDDRRLARVRERGDEVGYVVDGRFLFRADAHDAEKKTVLGAKLAAGRGIEDGEQVLDLLAAHPSTARQLARKLAVRFVADDPPAALVDRLAATFTRTGGDLRAVVGALVASREFWSAADARTEKVKSPFEVAVSALRALGATIDNPFPTLEWIEQMGQPLYAYQAPTGYPDRADFWVNTGALLARMNFGLELAAGRVGGVVFDLAALHGGLEPESAAAALAAYGVRLLPERDLAATMAQLSPLMTAPDLAGRISGRAPRAETVYTPSEDSFADFLFEDPMAPGGGRGRWLRAEAPDEKSQYDRGARASRYFPEARPMARPGEAPTVVAGVVGLILGSPEFQRR